MKNYLFLILIFSLRISPLFSQTSVPAGDVTGVWTKANSPYQVQGNILVPSAQQLLIEPGVIVEFMGHYRLTINGNLKAIGTKDEMIQFTKTDTVGLSDKLTPDGSWMGIALNYTYDTCIFSFCIVEYCNTFEDIYYYWEKAAIDAQQSKLRLENSIIRYNYGAIAGGLRIDYGYFEIINNQFFYNTGYSFGGAMHISSNGPKIIKGNSFKNNTGHYGGSMYISRGGLQIIIDGNFFSQNTALLGGAVYSTTDASAQFIQNLVTNNYALRGGGFYFENCGKVFINNTVCNNHAKESGGGIYFRLSTLFEAHNTILWGNKTNAGLNNVHIDTETSFPKFSYSMIEGGVGSFSGFPDNISTEFLFTDNPLFINPTAGSGISYPSIPEDWKIQSQSPCLNRGSVLNIEDKLPATDFFKVGRNKYGEIDLGFHEFYQSSMEVTANITSPTIWFADTVKIMNDISCNAKLVIAPGVRVEYQGYYSINSSDSIYFVGKESDPIVFTINDPTEYSIFSNTNGRWKYSWFSDTKEGRISYCNFEYGEGFYFYHCSNIVMDHCNITNCARAGSLFTFNGANIRVSNNIFKGNANINQSMAALLSFSFGNTILVENNQILGNSFVGINADAQNILIQNNLIANNSRGILATEGDNHHIYHNTIAFNANEGISKTSNTGIIANNIIWGNDYDIGTLTYVDQLYVGNNILQNERPVLSYETSVGNIVADPIFIKPPAGRGFQFYTGNQDYRVFSISPAINLADPNPPGTQSLTMDLDGNTRALYGLADIGAYEHTGSAPKITKQPAGGSLCEGTAVSIKVICQEEDTLLYQWRKDGADLPAETAPILSLTDLNYNEVGAYTCMISNTFGNLESYPANVLLKAKPSIQSVSNGIAVCENQAFNLDAYAAGYFPLSFSWLKDGVLVSGENSSRLSVSESEISDKGNYSSIVSNTCGADTSVEISVEINPNPVLSLGGDTIICQNTNMILDPGIYHNYLWNDYTANRFMPVNESGEFSVRVTDVKGCEGYSDTISVEVTEPYSDQEICLVTASYSGKNLVVWERPVRNDIETYLIYKESVVSDYYTLKATIPYDNISLWIDPESDPDVRSFRYRISLLDSCGNESIYSTSHKTMHLTVNQGEGGSVNLIWENYEGFDFSTYYIYRGESENTLELIDSIPNNLTTFTNYPPESRKYFYKIAVIKPDACVPSGSLKADTGPFRLAESNLESTDLNEGNHFAPTDIHLNNSSIDENLAPPSFIGKLSTSDPEVGESFIYSLVSGDGSLDNYFFLVRNDSLFSSVSFDYESRSVFSLRLRSTEDRVDAYWFEKVFIISAVNLDDGGISVNHAPASILLDHNSLEENQPQLSVIGRLSTIDLDAGDTHSYSFVAGSGDTDNSDFIIEGDLIKSLNVFDFEVKNRYSVRIRSTENTTEAFTVENAFTLFVTDQISENDTSDLHKPTDIILSNNMVDENMPVGTMLGVLSTVDPDPSGSHSYSLIPGDGSIDNPYFKITSNQLLTAGVFDYEKRNQYSIRLKSQETSPFDYSIEKVMYIYIGDVLETTGLDENQQDSDINIYPNPFTESTRLQFYNPEEKECIISISDLSGKEIRNYSTRTNFLFIERENMKSGVYIIEICGEKILRGRLVVL